MKTITYLMMLAVFVGASLSISLSAQAQTASSGSAPVLYDQNGSVTNGYNSSTGALNPGWYYTSSRQPLYYYANGMYYNPSTNSFGGSNYYTSGAGPMNSTSGTGSATGSGGTTSSGTAPVLYDQSGNVISGYNSSTGALNSGWYYTSSHMPIYYYSNGMYYDPATNSFGGSNYYTSGTGPVSSFPSGTAGTGGTTYTPGVPNTGAGGSAVFNWIMLVVSALVASIGLGYMAKQRLTVG